ncbi:MAG: Xaa-Pro peptidase family protein [Gammaproteobacteria bacterium]|nr:Xaa-Pro peptidase family protein [Gammaproteobacteria bacterium]MDE0413580.1 Xaa-Pro peptidase family protein [Gammaproteobacteria bacterium]
MEKVTFESKCYTAPSGATLNMAENTKLPFSVSEYLRRYDGVIQRITDAGVDALLVRSPENITYLTGYETPGYYGYHCLVISPREQPVIIGRKVEVISNAPEFSWLSDMVFIEDHEMPEEVVANVLDERDLANKRLGVEKAGFFFTVREYETLSGILSESTLVDCSSIVESARMIKSEEEVEMIRQAAHIADKAIQAGIEAVEPGVTEDQVAGALHKAWCEAGAEYTGLPNFIVSGPRAGICHATWRGRKIEKNDFCIMEIAASKNRYCGALFRGVAVGEPHRDFLKLADTTIEALEVGLGEIRPGAICEEVDAKVHSVFEQNGFGYEHKSRAAYSVGVNYPPDWGEGQIISIRKGEKRALQQNMCFHLVPGAMAYSQEMGMCTSATIRVTADGCEVLNETPAKLFRK